MATHTYYGYSPEILQYDRASGAFKLSPDFDPALHRIRVEITDDDNYLDGDRDNRDIGEDKTQIGKVFDADGSLIAQGPIYADAYGQLQSPGPDELWIDRIEIANQHLAYFTSEPLTPGNSYPVLYSADVDDNYNGSDTRLTYDQVGSVPCFGPGTQIMTTEGAIPVEWLATSHHVITRDHGAQPIRWIGRFDVTRNEMAGDPAVQPHLVPEGQFGPDEPDHPLLLSPQHRILLRGPRVALDFGVEEAFGAVRHLCPATRLPKPGTRFVYTHLLFDRHEVILANGLWVESLFAKEVAAEPGRSSGTPPPPDIRHPRTARRCLKGWEARYYAAIALPRVDETAGQDIRIA